MGPSHERTGFQLHVRNDLVLSVERLSNRLITNHKGPLVDMDSVHSIVDDDTILTRWMESFKCQESFLLLRHSDSNISNARSYDGNNSVTNPKILADSSSLQLKIIDETLLPTL
eukprot:scaffold9345_cov120-Cylindrotheca_fusiformis.AAC.20